MHFSLAISISALLVVQELDSTLRFVVFLFDFPLFPSLQVQDQVDLTLPSALSLASIFLKNLVLNGCPTGNTLS